MRFLNAEEFSRVVSLPHLPPATPKAKQQAFIIARPEILTIKCSNAKKLEPRPRPPQRQPQAARGLKIAPLKKAQRRIRLYKLDGNRPMPIWVQGGSSATRETLVSPPEQYPEE